MQFAKDVQYDIIATMLASMSSEDLDYWLQARARLDRTVIEIYVGLRVRYGWQHDAGRLAFTAETDDPVGWLNRLVSAMDLDDPFPVLTTTTQIGPS